jgi:hypothetical protein
MIAVHRNLRAGIGPAESLATSRAERPDEGGTDATDAALVTIGVGM